MRVYLSLRRCLLLITLLIFISQTFLIGICSSDEGNLNVERLELDLIEGDILAIYFSPRIENISVRCYSLYNHGAFDLSMSTNYVDPYLDEASALWIQLEEPGIYNLPIVFTSNKSWKYILGVYTGNRGFYSSCGVTTRSYSPTRELDDKCPLKNS